MAPPPTGLAWIGFTKAQHDPLQTLHVIGNNGWDLNGQTDEMMPRLDSSLARMKKAMLATGYTRNALHQLDRWEFKHTAGRFGQ
ncbi:hypothetical protein ACLUS2_013685 [Curtobacterium flaccumfaciens pv. flaccumfaciens]|uniref:hypothetical protein n=1 Tax=Curtobacterium flaccumfaciens TaxID=2035 RepID=UPI003994FBF1